MHTNYTNIISEAESMVKNLDTVATRLYKCLENSINLPWENTKEIPSMDMAFYTVSQREEEPKEDIYDATRLWLFMDLYKWDTNLYHVEGEAKIELPTFTFHGISYTLDDMIVAAANYDMIIPNEDAKKPLTKKVMRAYVAKAFAAWLENNNSNN